jgi:alpha-2-macroglobulin
MKVQPDAKLAPMLVKWLVNNRRGTTWQSTRDTAMAVYALAGYTHVRKELDPEYTLTLDLEGKVRREFTVTRENALFFNEQFIVPDELLETGRQTLTVTKNGPGALYYSAYTRYFSLEEPIRATGNEIHVRRRYFRLLPGTASGAPEYRPLADDRPNPFLTGRYELLAEGGEMAGYEDPNTGPRYERLPVKDGDTLTSGDLLEVELQLESKNDYDYLIFEDLKPAGCEPVEVRSGARMGLGVCSNMELRDQKVAFFLSSLPQGTRTLTYRLRAEIPGRFHVLPTNGYAMYAPDIRTLSDEMSFAIQDEPNPGN